MRAMRSPATCWGCPFIMVRREDNSIGVFHNVCSHRGAQLVGRGLQCCHQRLRCPYHAWLYDLEGNLIATPHIGGPKTNEGRRLRQKPITA